MIIYSNQILEALGMYNGSWKCIKLLAQWQFSHVTWGLIQENCLEKDYLLNQGVFKCFLHHSQCIPIYEL